MGGVGFGALLIGYFDDGKLRFAGKVGTGFDTRMLIDLHKRLKAIEVETNPFANGDGKERDVHFVEPRLVAEIAFAEWTQNHQLRQPRFEGLREDKKARQVKRENAAHLTGAANKERASMATKTTRRISVKRSSKSSSDEARPASRRLRLSASSPAKTQAANPSRVSFTHLEKVMFPDAQITKGDLLEYYANIAPKLLPHLKDRPITIEHLPDGLNGPHFWQKNTPTYYPDWIPRIELATVSGKKVQYALVNDLETLLYFVNQGTITFHVYLSRVKRLDHPDDVLFDLDPGESTFADAVTIAKEIHAILESQKVEASPKTSGKSGLHIVAPWTEKGGYDAARAWAVSIAKQAVRALPKLATTERSLAGQGARLRGCHAECHGQARRPAVCRTRRAERDGLHAAGMARADRPARSRKV